MIRESLWLYIAALDEVDERVGRASSVEDAEYRRRLWDRCVELHEQLSGVRTVFPLRDEDDEE